jgi:hypothetical protein
MGQNTSSIIGKPFTIENLEIAQLDFPEQMDWNKAKLACAKLGNGWRLPTKTELNKIYKNKGKIAGLKNNDYWSSSEDDEISSKSWFQLFSDGYQEVAEKNNPFSVRAVKTSYDNFALPQSAATIIGKPFTLGNLIIAQNDFPYAMGWNKATALCTKLGAGWRLPTKDELKEIYLNQQKIGRFSMANYWSSSENDYTLAWYLSMVNMGGDYIDKEGFRNVRAVKSK